MSEKANTFKIGIFTIAATGIALVAVAVLGAGALFQQTTVIETYMTESVQGLEVGAPVKIRGVRVGRVRSVGFVRSKYTMPSSEQMEGAYVLIEMEILDDKVDRKFQEDPEASLGEAIAHGLRVRMASAGLMGQAYLELVFLGSDAPPPLELAWTPDTPYIPSSQSLLGQITSAVERLANQLESADIGTTVKQFSKILTRVDTIVDEFDIQTLQKNANSLLADLQATNARIQTILENPAIDSTLAGAGDAFKELPATVGRIRGAAAQLEDILASEDTKKLISGLSSTAQVATPAAEQLRLLLSRVDRIVADQQSDIEGLISSLRVSAGNLQQLTDDARQNPSRLLFGRPPPHDEKSSKGTKK